MEEVTRDVCEVGYPPESYGRSPEEVEGTIQEVVEKIFRDEDGIVRSGVNGRTMKPLRVEEVRDRPYGIGTFAECSTIPPHLRPIWLNYENAQQASGKYIRALLQKYAVTQDAADLALVRKTFEAFKLLWENAATTNRLGRGWMPKPYAGIRDVSRIWETSADQYADTTLGLDAFHSRPAANGKEKETIREMIVSFADWWMEHHYTIGYMRDGTCYWKKLGYAHPIAYFLYLNALAYSFAPERKYLDAFQSWLDDSRGLMLPSRVCVNGSGLAIECLERLIELRPDYRKFWLLAAEANAEHMIELSEQPFNFPRMNVRTQMKAFVAHHLCAAHRLLPQKGYDRLIRELLTAYNKRADFYHITRGLRLDELDPRVTGDDYRNCFFAEGHICWLNAYWTLKRNELR